MSIFPHSHLLKKTASTRNFPCLSKQPYTVDCDVTPEYIRVSKIQKFLIQAQLNLSSKVYMPLKSQEVMVGLMTKLMMFTVMDHYAKDEVLS